MSTPQSLIEAALRLIKVNDPTAAELADGLEALNMMLNQWAASPQGVYKRVRDGFTLVASTSDYTYASGSTLDSARPTRIINATIRDSNNTDFNVEIIGADQYESFPLKSTETRPLYLHYDRAYPIGNVYLYPTPDQAYTLRIQSHKPLGAYSALDDTITLPPEYENAVKFNLAVQMAPEFETEVSQSVAIMAMSTYQTIANQNAHDMIPRIDTQVIGHRGRGYDINGDLWV